MNLTRTTFYVEGFLSIDACDVTLKLFSKNRPAPRKLLPDPPWNRGSDVMVDDPFPGTRIKVLFNRSYYIHMGGGGMRQKRKSVGFLLLCGAFSNHDRRASTSSSSRSGRHLGTFPQPVSPPLPLAPCRKALGVVLVMHVEGFASLRACASFSLRYFALYIFSSFYHCI